MHKKTLLYTGRKGLCPLVNDGLEGCYCNNGQAQDVFRTLYFCSDNYDECPNYRSEYKGSRRLAAASLANSGRDLYLTCSFVSGDVNAEDSCN
jgi:hypothetical protein